MQYKKSSAIGGIIFGALLTLGAQITASAQSRYPETDERVMRQALELKTRSYQASSLVTRLPYDPGIPRNAKELSKYQGIASKLGSIPEELVMEFEEKWVWPLYKDRGYPLTFKKFLLAKVIASNLEEAHPSIAADTLLWGLAKRKSYGQTMRSSGFSQEEARLAEKSARQALEASKH